MSARAPVAAPRLDARSTSTTIVAQVAGRAVGLLAVLGSTAIVARTVGIESYADWATVLTLYAFVAFSLDPGISPVILRRLAQHPDQAPSPRAMVPVRLAAGAIALLVIIGATIALRGTDVLLLSVVLGGQVIPRALVLNATPWLQLDHRLHRQTALEAITATAGLALLGIAAALDAPIEVLGLVGFLAPTSVLALLMRRELRITPSRARDVPGDMAPRVRSTLVEIAPLAVALLLLAAYTRSFVVFLNATADSEEVAPFLLAFQVIEQTIVAAGIVAGALLPILALRVAQTTESLLKDRVAHDLIRVAMGVGLVVAAGLLLVSEPFTRAVGGEDLADAASDLQLLAPVGAIIFPSIVLAYVYVSADLGRRYLRFTLVVLVANIIANVLFTLPHGAPASARISWGSEALVTALGLVAVARMTASGARLAVVLALCAAACVGASEVVAADVVAPAVGAFALLVVAALASGRLMLQTLRSVALGPAGSVPAPAGESARSMAAPQPPPEPAVSLRSLPRRTPRPLAALLAAVLLLGVAWTLVTPAWQTPDENSHFGYVQHLSETGELPGDLGEPAFSTEQVLAASPRGSNADQAAAQPEVPMTWSEERFHAWEDTSDALPENAAADGGGPNPASSNPPLYYLVEAPAYLVGSGASIFTRLELMRLTSLLWLIGTVVGAWLLAGEVFRRDRQLQLVTAGLVGLAPMIGFISASVNPDSALFATWSLSLWLGVRLVKRGPSVRGAAALFAAVGVACVVKATSYALIPAALLALAVALWRWGALHDPKRIALRPTLAALGGIGATLGAYVVWTRATGRAVSAQISDVTGATTYTFSPTEFLSYIWQYYLPRLPFQTDFKDFAPNLPAYDIFFKGAAGAFGWLEVMYANGLYIVLALLTLAVVGLALAGAWRDRSRSDLAVVAFLAVAALALVAGLHYTDYRQIKSGAGNFMQGRYLLPLMPLAGLALARAVMFVPPAFRARVVAATLGALAVLSVYSMTLVTVRFYA